MIRDKREISEDRVWQMYKEAPESANSDDYFWEFVERMIEEGSLDYDPETGKFYME